jgi:hypothetical protein
MLGEGLGGEGVVAPMGPDPQDMMLNKALVPQMADGLGAGAPRTPHPEGERAAYPDTSNA